MKTWWTLANLLWLVSIGCVVAGLVWSHVWSSDRLALAWTVCLVYIVAYTPVAAVRRREHRRRIMEHLCEQCGYSLVGSLEAEATHCPECGAEIPAWKVAFLKMKRY